MENLFTVKSSEYIDLLSKLHTSKPYNKIGKHLIYLVLTAEAWLGG